MRCALIALIAALSAGCTAPPAAHAGGIPERAYTYQRYAFAVWRDTFGTDAPVATLAAQIHQESAWRHDAQSPYAHGLAQFTPPTAEDMARWYPELRPADTGDPRWALRAQAYYMARLADGGADEPADWAFRLSAYNGGLGWTRRDRRQCSETTGCNPERWACHAARTPDPRRADWAIEENRDYVRRILTRHGKRYERAGWGRAIDVPQCWRACEVRR